MNISDLVSREAKLLKEQLRRFIEVSRVMLTPLELVTGLFLRSFGPGFWPGFLGFMFCLIPWIEILQGCFHTPCFNYHDAVLPVITICEITLSSVGMDTFCLYMGSRD